MSNISKAVPKNCMKYRGCYCSLLTVENQHENLVVVLQYLWDRNTEWAYVCVDDITVSVVG